MTENSILDELRRVKARIARENNYDIAAIAAQAKRTADAYRKIWAEEAAVLEKQASVKSTPTKSKGVKSLKKAAFKASALKGRSRKSATS